MNKFKNAAIKILQKHNKPLHYKEITELALEEGIIETEGATCEHCAFREKTNAVNK